MCHLLPWSNASGSAGSFGLVREDELPFVPDQPKKDPYLLFGVWSGPGSDAGDLLFLGFDTPSSDRVAQVVGFLQPQVAFGRVHGSLSAPSTASSRATCVCQSGLWIDHNIIDVSHSVFSFFFNINVFLILSLFLPIC